MKPNPTLFIADDDAEDISLLVDNLTDQGREISHMTFHNGLVLLNYLAANSENLPDLIVLDINMPVKNGFVTLDELKKHPLLQSIPVVMLSSSAREEDEKRSLQMGCVSYFTKPDSMQGYRELGVKILEFCI